jgi:hypothetical protein
MSEFGKLRDAVNANISEIRGPAFSANITGRELTEVYLSSFPEGTNPVFRTNTVHDCNCCKHFIRSIGNLLTIEEGYKLKSIWDVQVGGVYQEVADALSEAVKSAGISGFFYTRFAEFGEKINHHEAPEGGAESFSHFYCTVPSSVRSTQPGKAGGKANVSRAVFKRSLEEISEEALQTILELISDNNLYRGEEFKPAAEKFLRLKREYQQAEDKDLFSWALALGSSARFQSTVIGTMAKDLSDGMPVEEAVKKFESMVAPANYKRPKSLVTSAMVKKAEEEIIRLGYEGLLNRRHAALSDLKVSDVLFLDRDGREPSLLSGVATDSIAKTKPAEVSADHFLKEILPKSKKIQLFVTEQMKGSRVNLLTGPYVEGMFRWNNPFTWAYAGDVADSIKERVKRAGGVVDADVRCSLSWDNLDDLDLYVVEPDGTRIFFDWKTSTHTGGMLDIDMNNMSTTMKRGCVENIFWKDGRKMVDGDYRVGVHNYQKRESQFPGFSVEISVNGDSKVISYPDDVQNGARVNVATLSVSNGVVRVIPHLEEEALQGEFKTVQAVTLSPNHWGDNETGNRHLFFLLGGERTEENIRMFFNEHLGSSLAEHRKVTEVVGSKFKIPPEGDQLCGYGFSSTRPGKLVLKVTGVKTRIIHVTL